MGINFFKKSFTLIETIVVIGVIGLILPVVFAIFFVLTQQQTKIYRLNTIKKEGDYVVSLIENTIKKDAIAILNDPANVDNPECASASTQYGSTVDIYFLDKRGQWFGYLLSGVAIASDSSSLAQPINLTSTKTKISQFSVNCTRNSTYSQPTLFLSFDIEYCNDVTCNQTRPEEIALMHYQTRIKLRNN